ncbi:MAG: hypothetical protein Q8Q16_08315, partial [Betaproteobacteria bacterium]|nr:hypothetical protein [Betaproteobacteria bacterium]
PEALETLITRGGRSSAPAFGTELRLLQRFGVPRQRDWPAAPFSLIAEGGTPGSELWICADPVHLRIERNRMMLADSTLFRIARDEAEGLAGSINSHFGDSLVVYPMQPQRWYAGLAACPDMETTPLSLVRGGAIEARFARGPEAMRWQAFANELQMLLHDHPVNLAREARGELPVNSVWLWGAGRLPPLPARPSARRSTRTSAQPFQHVAASDPLARGLAQASGAQARDLAANAQAWLAEAGGIAAIGLIVLDSLAAPSDYGQAEAWREALSQLELNWFVPLLAALKQGTIGMLTVHLLGLDHALQVEVTHSDLRRFWRRPRPLAGWLARAT